MIFLAGREPDYLSAILYRGLVELLGPHRVCDIGPSYYLHDNCDVSSRTGRNITCEEIGRCAGFAGLDSRYYQDVGLLVINNSHLRDTGGSWSRAEFLCDQLQDSARVVYVIGDDHTGPYSMPPFRVTTVFQREIDPDQSESSTSQPLLFGCLSAWIHDAPSDASLADRPIDVFYAGSATDVGRRSLPHKMAQLCDAGLSIVCGSGKGISRAAYMDMLCHSKMAICPTGGGNCSDTLRNWEAIASGSLPILPSHPCRMRAGFGLEGVLDFDNVTWHNLVDRVLHNRDEVDWPAEALRLSALARSNTTVARARKVLRNADYDLEIGSV